jgi:RND family efflux transporter MFP subunit
MKRKVAYISIAIAVVIIALLVFQVFKKQWGKDIDANEADKALQVTIATVIQHEFRDEISTVGTLEAIEVSPLSPKVAGTVAEVLVDIGDQVKVGEVLARLDRMGFDLAVKQTEAAYAAAEAAIPQAIAGFEQAEKEYQRANELLAEKVIPQSRFEAAEAAYKAAKEAVTFAGAQRDQAKAAMESAKKHLNDADISSPISGMVVERNVEIGQAVSPGGQILRIIDQTSLKIDVALPEVDFGRFTTDTHAAITVNAFPDQEFPGKVSVVNQMVDRETRTFRVRVELQNPTCKLVDGMFARIKLSLEKKRTLSITRDALQSLPGSGTFYVFVVRDEKAEKRNVKIGIEDDQYAEVLEGLAEGEKIVTSSAGRLRSGAKVVISMKRKNFSKSKDKEK